MSKVKKTLGEGIELLKSVLKQLSCLFNIKLKSIVIKEKILI